MAIAVFVDRNEVVASSISIEFASILYSELVEFISIGYRLVVDIGVKKSVMGVK